jgi:tetratricopeptide (TPR) repeat protein
MANNMPEAVKAAEEALAQGYNISRNGDASWLSDYYVKNQQPQKAVDLYEQALEKNPQSAELLVGLSKLYSQLGQKQKAITTVRRILEFQPSAQSDVEEFIKTLQ